MDEKVAGLGVINTLEQMVKVLGFHDLGSFLIASAFVIVAVAFVVSMAIFFVKKHRERLSELEKVVHEVQKEIIKPEITAKPKAEPPQPLPITKVERAPKPVIKVPEPVKLKPIAPVIKPQVKADPAPKTTPAVKLEPVKAPVIAEVAPVKLEVQPVEIKEVEPEKTLGSALKNTRSGFIYKLGQLFSKNQEISDEDFEQMEAILFTADIGAKTAQKLLDGLKNSIRSKKALDKNSMALALKEEMEKIFSSVPKPEPASVTGSPHIIMFVGVNGAGKTTSIGKLGANLKNQGKKVLFAAGDTFRAAATEQLTLWGARSGIEVVSGKENADSASVLFEAIEKGKALGMDYVLCDTAGRLHTKVSLMEELSKVHRVVGKAMAGAPHEVLLVVDATMGQNAIAQAREFALASPLTGVVLSKLDGTAKGGVALGIVDELKVPIRYAGIGEKATDLKDFCVKDFIDALLKDA